MANELEIFEFLEEDAAKLNRRRRRTELRNESNPFDLDDKTFVGRYRLTKELAQNLCDELRPVLHNPKKSSDLPLETKVLPMYIHLNYL